MHSTAEMFWNDHFVHNIHLGFKKSVEPWLLLQLGILAHKVQNILWTVQFADGGGGGGVKIDYGIA